MLKIPKEVIRYEEEIFDTIDWAVENGYIEEDKRQTIVDEIKEIKYKLFPEENKFYKKW